MTDRDRSEPDAAIRPAFPALDAILAGTAVAVLILEFAGWQSTWPEVTPMAVVLVLAVPLLVRIGLDLFPRDPALGWCLSPIALAALPSTGPGSLVPLWGVAVLLSHLALDQQANRALPRAAITIIGGAAMATTMHVLGPDLPAGGGLVAGLLAYVLVVTACRALRHRRTAPPDRRGPGRSGYRIGAALAGLALVSALLVSLRGLTGTSAGGPVVVLALATLAAGGLLVLHAQGTRRGLDTLSASALGGWPAHGIEDALVERALEAVRARDARVQDAPGSASELSAPIDSRSYLVLRRRAADVPFTDRDHRVAGALAAMAAGARRRSALDARLKHQVSIDDLTGLRTWASFHSDLEEVSTARGPGETLAVLYLDLDGFRDINDQLGHLAADAVLREIGERLRERLPADALPARLGGDEFGCVVRQVRGEAHLDEECERLASLIATPIPVDGQLLQIDVSIGIARSTNLSDAVDQITTRAYEALRLRKATRPAYTATPRWANERAFLRDLVDGQRIEVTFQPVVDLQLGRLHGYEATLHAADEDFGRLSPMLLVGAAERMSLLDDLALALAEEAVPAMAKLLTLSDLPLRLAMNLEFDQLVAGNPLLAALPELATEAGVGLTLQIPERNFGRWGATQELVARRLRESGVSLAIDEFGAGYSTFSLLNDWDWAWVKLDSTLVTGRNDPQGRTLLRHVAEMLTDLRMAGIAAGVDGAEQLQRVRNLGVRYAQGHHLGSPLSPAETIVDLERHGVEREAWRV